MEVTAMAERTVLGDLAEANTSIDTARAAITTALELLRGLDATFDVAHPRDGTDNWVAPYFRSPIPAAWGRLDEVARLLQEATMGPLTDRYGVVRRYAERYDEAGIVR